MAVLVDEFFAESYAELVAAARRRGIRVTARDGYRSLATQAAVLRRRGAFGKGGTAAPVGRSYHNYGLALDVAIRPVRWSEFGELAESLGFRWGGRFSTPEPWHIDLGDFFSIEEATEFFIPEFMQRIT